MGRFDEDSDSPLLGGGMSELRSAEIEREEERLRLMQEDQRRRLNLVQSAQVQARSAAQQAGSIKKQAERIKKLQRLRRLRCIGCCFSTTCLWIFFIAVIIVVVIAVFAEFADALSTLWNSIGNFLGLSETIGTDATGQTPTAEAIQRAIDFLSRFGRN